MTSLRCRSPRPRLPQQILLLRPLNPVSGELAVLSEDQLFPPLDRTLKRTLRGQGGGGLSSRISSGSWMMPRPSPTPRWFTTALATRIVRRPPTGNASLGSRSGGIVVLPSGKIRQRLVRVRGFNAPDWLRPSPPWPRRQFRRCCRGGRLEDPEDDFSFHSLVNSRP